MKRVKLTDLQKIENQKVAYTINGFGDLALKLRYGVLIKRTKRLLYLRIYDEEEFYTETFSIKTGIRIADIGNSDGWRINLSELNSDNKEPKEVNKSGKVLKVHEEVIPYASDDELIYQVWRDTSKPGKSGFYLKAFRRRITVTTTNGKQTSSEKQLPATVPLDKLIEIFADFSMEI